MPALQRLFGQKSLVVVFAYAPAGLGHLRVTKTLYDGLPKNVTPLLLGSHDRSISAIHRISSIHPTTRALMELAQSGTPEDIFTYSYRYFLRSHADKLYDQLITILEQRIDLPQTVLVVATHFGLAHQLSAIKSRLMDTMKVKIVLVVQVTDDSPQQIWYVEGADLIVVPSERTKDQLSLYGRRAKLKGVNMAVVPYPVSPHLAQSLSPQDKEKRQLQVSSQTKSFIHIAIPISGAAVGLDFFSELIKHLSSLNPRFMFHVICKIAPYTQKFLNQMYRLENVHLYVSEHDRQLMEKYEHVYKSNLIACEITKPSEQAFKALLKPTQVGGSLLMFTTPIGRQEYDNLFFLKRHHLIPRDHEHAYLWECARHVKDLQNGAGKDLLVEAASWRGLRLPEETRETAEFIWWCFKVGILVRMLNGEPPRLPDHHKQELGDKGVKLFWAEVGKLLHHV